MLTPTAVAAKPAARRLENEKFIETLDTQKMVHAYLRRLGEGKDQTGWIL
ncbi:MAG: hypothetical protein AB8A35_07675 [Prochlorococcus sp.]|jgi:hypothetical protein